VNRPETPPPAPAVVASLFRQRDSEINRYVDLLATAGVERGLIGPREVPRLWERHILNCAVIAPAFGPATTVCDVGSGAGLPGLVLAMARPDLAVTLLEPLLRRTTFLDEVVTVLALDNVEVVRGRAEDLAGVRTFDAVTARAVAPLDRLASWCLPLCVRGGQVVAMKGSSAAGELALATEALRRLGAGACDVLEFGLGIVEPVTTVVRIQSAGTTAKPSRRRHT
jgi:16S rRNA (guanine527-N7)-methyltransferase